MGINLEGYVRLRKKVMLGGKEFTFSELSLADFAKFRAWVMEQRDKNRDKRRERLIEQAKKIGNIDPFKLLEQLEKPPTDGEIEAEMETVEGMGYLSYLSLKYAHPEITLDDAMQIISVENIPEVAGIITGGMKEEPKKKRTSAKKS